MRRRQQFFPLILILLCFQGLSLAQNWAGIVAPSRAVDWSDAGVEGGIPARTTNCTTLSAGASISQINSAISSCPSGQTVFLNAGTYNLSGGVDFNGKDGVTLRGAGADKTFLVFSNNTSCRGASSTVCLDSTDTNWKGQPSNLANWTAGFSKGTTTITLSSVPNLKVGFPIILDQTDDTSDNGAIVVSDSTSKGPFSLEGNGGGAQRSGRQQLQIVTVKACNGVSTVGAACSGSNVSITISPGLYMPNWSSSKSPQAWWATNPIMNSGVEDLSIDVSGTTGAGVEFFNCSNCWVKGVRDVNSSRAHVQVQYGSRITVRDSYFFLTRNSVSQSYGVECYAGSDLLVENNIFQAVAAPQMINGACSGTVIGYNFSINNYYTASSGYNISGTNLHTAGIDNVLYEGNVGNQIYGDLFHGTHHFVTAFRNRWSGTQPACYISGSSYSSATFGTCNSNLSAVVLDSYSRFFNFVGNVLGTAGVNKSYQNGSADIYGLGDGNSEGSVSVPSDANVENTLLRWGNYDTVTGGTKFDATEVPTGLPGAQAPYSNSVPGSQNLPDSFYYSAQPRWWPSSKPWPPIGPDVSGGNIANVGGHAYTIPAQDCFTSVMGGNAAGTGPVLTFSASKCYGSTTGGGTTNPPPAQPNPPTGLNATVN